jgi:hypothetical protein
MRRASLSIVALAALAVSSRAGAGTDAGTEGGANAAAPRECVQSWPEARMQAYGYNHIVHLKNACDAPAECVVTTDVNPDPTKVSVPAKTETEINTYLGSPARVFTPKVVCTLRALGK